MAKRSAVRVKGHTDMSGLLFGEHLFQGVEETEDGRDILALAVDARVLDKAVVGSIDERVSVE